MSDAEDLPDLAIAGTRYLLVEMPMQQWSDRNLRELEEIYQKRKLTPIVAHIDRYIAPLRTHAIPERLAALPVLVQANAGFFTGRFTQRLALKLLRRQQIHLLGSDCHNTNTRPPNIGAALQVIERSLGAKALERIHSSEADILSAGKLV